MTRIFKRFCHKAFISVLFRQRLLHFGTTKIYYTVYYQAKPQLDLL